MAEKLVCGWGCWECSWLLRADRGVLTPELGHCEISREGRGLLSLCCLGGGDMGGLWCLRCTGCSCRCERVHTFAVTCRAVSSAAHLLAVYGSSYDTSSYAWSVHRACMLATPAALSGCTLQGQG